MTEIPLYTTLFVYILFVAIFAVFSLVNFYHIFMTASLSFLSFMMTFFIFTCGFLIIYLTWWLLQDVNWQQILISLPSFGEIFNRNF